MATEATYYQKNVFLRNFDSLMRWMRGLPATRVNAIAFAVVFFVILIAFLEYKVFESTLTLTGSWILAASVMSVTAFGGVLAEVVLRRHKEATDDQLMYADWIFYVSLVTSAIAGFGIWAQSASVQEINILDKLIIPLPEFASFVFFMVTVVTVVDILILREYIRGDVRAVHARNQARAQSTVLEARLELDKQLMRFDADVVRQTEPILAIEKRRVEVRNHLQTIYGGNVPANVMETAMMALDRIMVTVAGGELNPANALASDVDGVEIKPPALPPANEPVSMPANEPANPTPG